jgi:hypothetical protein
MFKSLRDYQGVYIYIYIKYVFYTNIRFLVYFNIKIVNKQTVHLIGSEKY